MLLVLLRLMFPLVLLRLMFPLALLRLMFPLVLLRLMFPLILLNVSIGSFKVDASIGSFKVDVSIVMWLILTVKCLFSDSSTITFNTRTKAVMADNVQDNVKEKVILTVTADRVIF